MIAVAIRAVAVSATSLFVLAGLAAPAAAASDPGAAAVPQCATSDLALRQVKSAATTPSPDAEALFALQNAGAASCTVSGGIGIRLFDAQGKPIELRFAVRNTMAMLITLAPGEEATFSVGFAPHPPMDSVTTARIDVYLTPQSAPVSAPAAIAAYGGPAVRVSNLRRTAVIPAKFMSP